MKEEVLRTIKHLESKGWITINEHLEPAALAAVFVEVLKDMPLSKFVEIFNPFEN